MAVPAVKLFGDWDKIPEVATLAARFRKSVEQAILKEGQRIRRGIVKGLESGSPAGQTFAPLSPITLAIRQAKGFSGTKPLNVTGTLRGAITVKRIGKAAGAAAVFVGLLRQSGGARPVNLGEIHEFGRTWTQRLTRKSRRFLFAMLKKGGLVQSGPRLPSGRFRSGGGGSVTITIPARPFVSPIVEQERPKMVARFWENVAKGVNGDLWKPR